MPAIAGVVNLDRGPQAREGVVESMLAAMRTTQPEVSHIHTRESCRAVIGCNAAVRKRPLNSGRAGNPDVIACCVGEIYDDSSRGLEAPEETLAARYLESPAESFGHNLNGSFAGAIADARDGSLFLITDHAATQGLFTAVFEGSLYFASEVKGLLAARELPAAPDSVSVIFFVIFFFPSRRGLDDFWHFRASQQLFDLP